VAKLSGDQHAVLHVDPHTGIVLDEQGKPAQGRAHYRVFATRAEAEQFVVRAQAAHPKSEWHIIDAEGVTVRTFMDAKT
jgi:hypothetical protein